MMPLPGARVFDGQTLLVDHALVVDAGGAANSCHRPSCQAHQEHIRLAGGILFARFC